VIEKRYQLQRSNQLSVKNMFSTRQKIDYLYYAVVFAIFIGYLWHCLAVNYVVDDSFISFRYVKNFINGDGLVFNPGERVEGYTNFLWIMILSGFLWVIPDANLLHIAQALGIIFGFTTIFLVIKFSCLIHRRLSIFCLIGAAFLALNSGFCAWSTSGMETILFTFLIFLGCYLYVYYFKSDKKFIYAPILFGLAARYEFEGNLNDSSGKGRTGTAMGNPTFVAGKVGQAISLDGFDDSVQITGYKGILGPSAVTVTAWINTTSTVTGTIAGWGPNVDGQRFDFRINENRLRIEHGGGNLQGNSNVNDSKWHHVAVTLQDNATISYPDVILYVDGIDDTRPSTDPAAFNLTADQDVRIGSRPSSNDRFFMGLIDDVRIYDRALTQEEIAWLAGRTKSFDKPF
jgi:hypothetical protein